MADLQGMTLPTCDILVNGQLRKLYGKKKNKVYLHNGDNFQLKFFNPLQERIGVQLKMNGVKVDNDLLIINPGQEITIERYIGTNRKLTFSSYDINTSNMSPERYEQAVKAIEKNGILEVIFWNEKIKKQPDIPYTIVTTYPKDWYYFPYSGSTISGGCIQNTTTDSTADIVINGDVQINGTVDINGRLTIKPSMSGSSGCNGTSGKSGTSGSSGLSGTRGYKKPGLFASEIDYSMSTDYSLSNMDGRGMSINATGGGGGGTQNIFFNSTDTSYLSRPLKIETGRIEKGSVSTQYFSQIAFEVGEPFYSIKFKLLPFSLKPVKKKLYDSETIKNIIEGNTYVRNESSIREYCKCGYRISRGKGSWMFCPQCGRKLKK
jgi:hypothetical protein